MKSGKNKSYRFSLYGAPSMGAGEINIVLLSIPVASSKKVSGSIF